VVRASELGHSRAPRSAVWLVRVVAEFMAAARRTVAEVPVIDEQSLPQPDRIGAPGWLRPFAFPPALASRNCTHERGWRCERNMGSQRQTGGLPKPQHHARGVGVDHR
jgi:hypothetical protein